MQAQTSGNYIHNLQMAVREQHALLQSIQETYGELVIYLSSPKFYNDPTVQVADVLRRLEPIRSAVLQHDESPVIQKLTQPVIATGEITSL